MNGVATQQRFVQLRCESWSFARIAEELNVSKPTLIKWSRKLQYDIQNQRAIHLEALREASNSFYNKARTHFPGVTDAGRQSVILALSL